MDTNMAAVVILSALLVAVAVVAVRLKNSLTKKDVENAVLNEKLTAAEEILKREREESENRFGTLARSVLSQTAREMKEKDGELLSSLLVPFEKNLAEFRNMMEYNFRSEAEGRAALRAHIDTLRELNSSIGREAKELAAALRGNSKIQGDWGEMILTSLLEKSGLIKDVHYSIQQTRDSDNRILTGETGNMLRPDVVINYPDGKRVVVDSKVSLTAYTAMVNAGPEEEREIQRRLHLKSVRRHVDELAVKDYPMALGVDSTLDFTLMFIPHEPAYLAAMESDPALWDYAYSRRVVIVSPTHLLSVLKLLSQLWQQDKVNRNNIRIAEESGKMLDMLFAFKDELDAVEKALEQASAAHARAAKRLYTGNGNVARRASTLIELGAKTKKSLPGEWEESGD